MMSNQSAIFVSVGTDHHPFDRLVTWGDALSSHPAVGSVFVQRGTSTVEPASPSSPLIDATELRNHLSSADVVVCHGGPSTIMEAKAHGHLPIVVPRNPDLGEHVDGHQIRFCEHLERSGAIHFARSAQEVADLVTQIIAAGGRGPATDGQAPATTLTAISNELDRLTSKPRRRLLWLQARADPDPEYS